METDLRVEDVTEHSEDRLATPPPNRLAFRLFIASVVAALVPVAVATVRAIRDGWIPIGDNALFVIRGRDLFSHHLPLLGTYSSASLTAGTDLNHPGPLYFDLLAVPARLVESGAGIAFGVAVVNSLCIVGIALFAYRRGGALLGTVAMAATAALSWAMGSALLFEPWNPHSVLLPFLLFLFLVWSLTDGDLLALPFAAAAGSLVVQTHLSYVLLVPLLGAWGIAGAAIGLRAQRHREPAAWPARRRQVLRFAAVGGVVLVVCWIQPMIEQFTSDGSGNLTLLVESSRGSDAHTIGYGLGTRIVATVVSLPPWWFPPSLKENFISGWRAPSLGVALLSLGVLIAILAWCGWEARRRRDRVSWWAIATAFVALLAALVTAGQGPITVFGNVTPHTFRWLWPMGAFVFFAVVAAFARRFIHSGVVSPRLVGVFVLVTLAVAALNLPRAEDGLGPNSQQYAIPTIRDLERHMGALERQGPLLIDDVHGAFATPYGWAVVAELQRRGIPFVARDPGTVRQLGPARRFNGHNAKAALLLREGEATFEAPPGSRRVARGEGLPADDVRELERLKTQIGDSIAQHGLVLNARGQAALEAGMLPTMSRASDATLDVPALFATRELDFMIRERYVVLDVPWRKRFARYADLQHQWDQKTVALFVGPVSSARTARA
jgi:hypothetical protein